MCGKGLTKRLGRPQIEQRSQRPASFSSRTEGATRSVTATGIGIISPHPNGAGEMTEGED
jgi:hypothetical protein